MLTESRSSFKTVLNLLILIDSLEDPALLGLSMDWADSKNTAIRYWAVHSVTSTSIIEQLNSGGSVNSTLAERIAEKLRGVVETSTPEVLGLIAEFAAKVDTPRAEDLLMQVADVRIRRYADWTVEYELLDGAILKLLDSNIAEGRMNVSAVGRRFGQLYSYVIQRYVKGQDVLSATQKQQLVSVLIETEILCISKRLGVAQSVIKSAVEQNDYSALMEEHSRLLGDEAKAGQLSLKIGFDYGKKPDGKRRIAPLVLPEPP